MTSATVGAIIDRTVEVLDMLAHRYQALARALERSDEELAHELAAFLAGRERETIAALAKYRADVHPLALETHVRLSNGFPFTADDLELSEHPTLDEMASIAERADYLLEHLSERIRVYAAGYNLAEILAALEQLVAMRRRQLAGALNEFEELKPKTG
jgi:hypothetical protein